MPSKEFPSAIEKGDFISIAGPSGSGKTTILNMIGLIDKVTSGQVVINGKATSGLTDKELIRMRHETLGFIFQSFNLIPVLNVWENIEFPLLLGKLRHTEVRKKELDRLAHRGNRTRRVAHATSPTNFREDSVKRVAIARALATKPTIVLADEPTANLDSGTGEQIIELMKKINRSSPRPSSSPRMTRTSSASPTTSSVSATDSSPKITVGGKIRCGEAVQEQHGGRLNMPVIIRMAFRNLLEHRSKSLIVGILLAMGVLILVVGNSFIDASATGIRLTFTDSYTGDVFISGKSSNGKVSLFGVQSVGGLDATPNIPDYENVPKKVASLPGSKASPVSRPVSAWPSGMSMISTLEIVESGGTE